MIQISSTRSYALCAVASEYCNKTILRIIEYYKISKHWVKDV